MNFNSGEIKTRITQLQSNKGRLGRHLAFSVFQVTLALTLVVLIIAGYVAAGAVQSLIDKAPDIDTSTITPSAYSTTLYDLDGNVMETLVMSGSNREEVTLSDIPQNLINAFVSIEDERFNTHMGIDLKGIVRAAVKGLVTGDFSEGGSTITQQLIKNSVFSGGTESTLGARIERKIQEQYLAVKLEEEVSKNVILVNYLNNINLGNNTLGVQTASKRYFGKDVSELTLSECAVIAAITQNPTAYNPIRHPEANQQRQQRVLLKMKEQGYISQSEYDEAIADDVYARIQQNATTVTGEPYSYFTDAVIDAVMSDLQEKLGYTQTQAYSLLYGGGLSIYTTMDPEIQEVVDEEVNDPENYPYTSYSITYRLTVSHADGTESNYDEGDLLEYINGDAAYTVSSSTIFFDSEEQISTLISAFQDSIMKSTDIVADETLVTTLQPQVSMVIMDQSTGEVRAISGGRGEKTASLSLNRATDSLRQPGSTFKVLSTFAPALDSYGLTLASVFYDSPVEADGQSFSNWWGDEYLGYVNMRQAIAYSMNLATVHCLLDTVTVNTAFRYVEAFGITSLVESRVTDSGQTYTDKVASIALGGLTDGVTNLELTAAYATIANQGEYNSPIFYTKILDNNGKVLLENEAETKTVIKKTTAELLTYAMESTMDDTTTSVFSRINQWILPTGGAATFSGMTLAGKSGSTTNNNDIWFVGYSPYYTCGIWSGYDKDRALESSQVYHKTIWKKVMERIHEDLPDIGWEEDEDLIQVKICSKSGLLAVDGVCDHEDSTSEVYEEWFVKGTEPTEYCDVHVKVEVCKKSNALANEYCPLNQVEERVYMVLSDAIEALDVETDDTDHTIPERLKNSICKVHGATEEEEESSSTKSNSLRSTEKSTSKSTASSEEENE